MFSNLIDLTLVEYSTSKLKTHIKRKVSPVGHSKCLQKVLHWLRLLLWFRQKQYRAELLSKQSPNSLQSQVSNCRAHWMAVDRSSQPGTSSCLSVCLSVTAEGESGVPSTCLHDNLQKWFFPLRATLVQKLQFVSTVTHFKFRMFWVSDTHTTHTPTAVGSFWEEN